MYFHENFKSPDDFMRFLVTNANMTLGELGNEYKKPQWCQYDDAVKGGKAMGCMSLWNFNIKNMEDCKGCDQCES